MSAAAVARRCRGIALALCVAIVSCLLCVQAAEPANLAVEQVAGLVDAGRFEAAETGIADALAQAGLSPAQQRAYAWQRERMRRILLDFTLDESEVEARVRKQIPDLTDAEFAKWRDAGLFERQVIDGRTLYFNRSPSNLFRLSDEALARRDPAGSEEHTSELQSLMRSSYAVFCL